MIDVSPKNLTLRYARAEGRILMNTETALMIREDRVPKGNVIEVARAAGVAAAKRTADWIIFCHPIPLDWVEVVLKVEEEAVLVTSEVRSVWRTGVEMEALTAVHAALLNVYDMIKPLTRELEVTGIRLVEKRGGKSQYNESFDEPIRTAILVISDSTFAGERKDKSGKVIRDFLESQPVTVEHYEVLPDDEERIRERVRGLIDDGGVQLVLTTGGTGLGPKDVTPEALQPLFEKVVPGVVETLRKFGGDRTPYAMLSREVAGLRKGSLIVTLPGSSRGALEGMQALFPGLLHGFSMIAGGGHGGGRKSK